MEYCLGTREKGLVSEPDQSWDNNPEFELLILGQPDSNYAKYLETRNSGSGTSKFLCGAPIIQQSMMQKVVAFICYKS